MHIQTTKKYKLTFDGKTVKIKKKSKNIWILNNYDFTFVANKDKKCLLKFQI